MVEDWIGEVGLLEIAQADPEGWHEVRFAHPIGDAVVVAAANSRNGGDPFTLAVRNVTESGFEILLDEWDYLDGIHGRETVSWIAVPEGRHRLADGRVIEAGAATLATPTGLRFAELRFGTAFDAAPVVLAQVQSETRGATTTRLDDVTADGFLVSVQREEASAGRPVAATVGWIALATGTTDDAAVGLAGPVGHDWRPVPLGTAAEAVLAQMQTAHGADPATVEIAAVAEGVAVMRIGEEASADDELRHAPERVGFAAFVTGPFGAVPGLPVFESEGPVERWSDPATWGGTLPGPGDLVTIEAGRTVLLDTDATVAGLLVQGTLLAADSRDLALTAGWMLVAGGGDFVVGSPADPFDHRFTLTLAGAGPSGGAGLPAEVIRSGHIAGGESCERTGGTCRCTAQAAANADAEEAGFLIASGSGSTLSLHGADAAKAAWTRLNATAPAGTREIRLAEAPGWQPGDRIVIAPTDFEPREAETATILSVSADGRTLRLDRALAFAHFGELQRYGTGTRDWELDVRAEVGLLSRNIVVQGAAEAAAGGKGAHMMAMAGAEMRLSGVELSRMGEAGTLGRYPVHWHMLGDAAGQYITDSAIHGSFNRAVTVHGTNFVRVAHVVTYDIVGHAFFLENGTETGNRFEANLGVLTRAPDAACATIPTDATHVSTFWITNPANDFIGNVAAGSEHGGFWFAPGPGADTAPLGRFEGNAGHSSRFANLAFDGHADPATGAFVEGEYRPEQVAVVRDFTSSKASDRAIWVRAGAMDFHDVKSADNARATFFSYNQTLYDSLIVGRSANAGTPETPEEIAQGRSLPEPYNGRYFRGHSVYDGPSGVIDTHFAGFGPRDAAFQTNGAAQKSPAHFVSGLSFEGVTGRGRIDFGAETGLAHMWSSGLLDLDGSLTGQRGAWLTPVVEGSAFNAPEGAALRAAWGAWQVAGAPVGLLRADSGVAPGTADTVLWSRSDGESLRAAGTFDRYHQAVVALDTDLTYRLQYHAIPADLTLSVRFTGAGEAVVVALPGFPADARVAGAVEVADRAALAAAGATAFLREGTTLVVRLVADAPEADPRFVANTALPGALGRAHVAGVTIASAGGAPVLAEPSAAGGAADAFLFRAAPGEDAPGEVAPAAFRVALDRQDLGGFAALVLAAEGAETLRVLLHDAEEGWSDLGLAAGGRVDLGDLAPGRRDAVDAILFRAEAPGATLYRVGLEAALQARAVQLPVVVPAGEVFAILGAAVLGAQATPDLALVAVGEATGGTAWLSADGDVILATDPQFRGIARIAVTLRDDAGREAATELRVEVAPA